MLKLGDLLIESVVECVESAGKLTETFPDATDEAIESTLPWLAPSAYDLESGEMVMPVQTYVLRSRHHTILVDTCIGNHKRQPGWSQYHMRKDFRLLDALSESGVHPDEVDYVFCTHMHADHVGWNTKLANGRWVPSFPRAKYIFSKTELEFSKILLERDGDLTYEESVLPIIESGQSQIVESDFSLDDEIWLEPTPGHTPGHVAIHLKSRKSRGVISGDLIHSPVQLAYPEWSPFYDNDRELACRTRRQFLERNCDRDIVVMTMHFPLPSIGHIIERGRAFGMKYVGCEMTYG